MRNKRGSRWRVEHSEDDKALVLLALDLQMSAFYGDPKALLDLDFAVKLYRAFLKKVKEILGLGAGQKLLNDLAVASVLDPVSKTPALVPSVAASVKSWFTDNVANPVVAASKGAIVQTIAQVWNQSGSKIVAIAKEGVLPQATFTLQDARAIGSLSSHSMYWIREAGVRTVDTRIAAIVQDALSKGYGRKEVARILEQQLSTYHQIDASRWVVTASAALNRARTFGQITEFQSLQIHSMQFNAVNDERTCPICSAFHGHVYSVESGAAIMDRAMAAQTPDEFIDAQPWVGLGAEGMYVRNSAGDRTPITPDTAAEAGAINPPIHARCRCELLPYLQEIEQAVTRTVAAEQAREEYKQPQDLGGVPLSDKLGGANRGTTQGWHTGEIERALRPGAKEAKFLSDELNYSVTPKGWTARSSWSLGNNQVVQSSLHHTGFSLEGALSGKVRVPATVVDRMATEMASVAKAHKLPGVLTIKPGMLPDMETLGACQNCRLAGGMRASFQKWAMEQGHGAELANQSVKELLQSASNGQTLVERWLGSEWKGKEWTLYL